MTSTWHKAKQFIAPSIKIVVLITCAIALYYQWQERPLRLDNILYTLKKIPFLTITIMLLLSLASWLVESKKWQLLVKDIEETRFRESVLQSLTAQAASFITPLRAGEFAFKALFFKKSQRRLILSRVFTGNFSQMIVTLFLGLIGLTLYLKEGIESILFMILTIILICSIMYIGLLWALKKWNLKSIPNKLWIKIISYSTLRYILFSSNWLLILWTLKNDISIISWLDKVIVNYLAVSIIPMFQVLDIPVRWTTASYIFNGSTYNDDYILIATTLIWFTNTLFPTFIGWILLPFKKFKTI